MYHVLFYWCTQHTLSYDLCAAWYNTVMSSIPLDLTLESTYARLPEPFYRRVRPQEHPLQPPFYFNAALAAECGLKLDPKDASTQAFLSGQNPELQPLAMAYAGHQYAHFTLLGDGRAVLLGELTTPSGARVDLHLKGSGPTPYARGGDGQATLEAMLKEVIIGEALHGLGIPSSRILAINNTGKTVQREKNHRGASALRVAASHLRVGTFELAQAHPDPSLLPALYDYTKNRHDPDASDVMTWLKRVIVRQAHTVALWQLSGFVHGVMNTDNAFISGETCDFGPCAFLDAYRPQQTFSSIDLKGRYAYDQQPYIASWNMARLALSVLPLLDENKTIASTQAQEALALFGPSFEYHYYTGLAKKLGFKEALSEDRVHYERWLALLAQHERDFTLSFLDLTDERFNDPFYQRADVAQWLKWRQTRLKELSIVPEDRQARMRQHNPALIARNIEVKRRIEQAAEGDFKPFNDYLALLQIPFEHSPQQQAFAAPPQDNPRRFVTTCGT